MNQLLSALDRACRQHGATPKLLVAPSLAAGHQLLEDLARGAGSWWNLAPTTPFHLAQRVMSADLEVLTAGQVTDLVEEILEAAGAAERLQYFGPIAAAPGLAELMARMVTELRLAGIAASNLSDSHFADPSKGSAIRYVLESYECLLEQRGLLDVGGLCGLALGRVGRGDLGDLQETLLVPRLLELPPLPDLLLSGLLARLQHRLLPSDPVLNARAPRSARLLACAPPQPTSPFSWVLSDAVPAGTTGPEVTMFRAYGAANEVREVLRRVLDLGHAADRVLICYTDATTYVPLLCSVAESLNLPLTVTGGVPLTHTRPGRLALGLCRWLAADHPASGLYHLLLAGLLDVEQPQALAALLREARVGWGRPRYGQRLVTGSDPSGAAS